MKFGLRTVLLWVFGLILAILTAPFVLLVLWRVPYSGGFQFADGLMIFSALFFGAGAVFAIGLALKKPVGLRLDAHGLSGYYAPTLEWSDIRQVPQRLSSGGKIILLDLKDPKAYWARQSRAARVMQALNLQAGMVAVTVHMIKAKPDDILNLIHRYHARYGS